MKIQEIFIGRFTYWLLLAAVVVILALLGFNKQHVRDFVPFQFTVIAVAIVAVAAIMLLYKPGERITREPIDGEDKETE